MEAHIRALVTGATGFIGRNLVKSLVADGDEVHFIARSKDLPADLKGAQAHPYTGSAEQILSAVESSRPDVVFHLASLFLAEHRFEQIPELCESNVSFGTQLVDAMVKFECLNLVSAGTAWQNFNGKKGTATNLYAATKEAFEVILRYYADACGLAAVVLKLNDTYGPGDPRRKLLSILRDAALKQQSLGLSPGEQKIDLLHVSDVIRALKVASLRVVESSSPGVEEFYLRSGRLVSIKELVEVFVRSSGQFIDAKWGERSYRAREVMIPWQQGEVLPGWKPEVSLENGIREYVLEGLSNV